MYTKKEKRSLLRLFYKPKQKENEALQDYLYRLHELLKRVTKADPRSLFFTRQKKRSAVSHGGRVFWSSAILYPFLALCFLHSSFFDVKIFCKANELCGNALECLTHEVAKRFLLPEWSDVSRHRQSSKFFSTRVSFYPNLVSTFNLTRLTTSGDINPNPGPSSNGNSVEQCPVCRKTVASNHRPINCDVCTHWCHIKCGGVLPREYQCMQTILNLHWTCPICIFQLQSLPFANTDNLDSSLSSWWQLSRYGYFQRIWLFTSEIFKEF